MNDFQKERIRNFRKEGRSYKQIADDMRISINTVKSFCRREKNRKATSRKCKRIEQPVTICRYCGKPLVFTPGKKKKQFCDDRCRTKYWTEHRNELAHNITYTFKCVHCGKKFTIYGKCNRKYCSQKCYFAERFGSTPVDEIGSSVSCDYADSAKLVERKSN